jgi:hypothetical protein
VRQAVGRQALALEIVFQVQIKKSKVFRKIDSRITLLSNERKFPIIGSAVRFFLEDITSFIMW